MLEAAAVPASVVIIYSVLYPDNPEIVTVLLTGRLQKQADLVKRITDSIGYKFDHYLFNNRGGTLQNKIGHLNDLLVKYPDVRDIELWDDRVEHADEFKEWGFDITENSVGSSVVKHYTESDVEDFFVKTEEDCTEEFNLLLKRNKLILEVMSGLKVKYKEIMEDRFINRLSYQAIVDKNNDPIHIKINSLLDEILCTESLEEKQQIYFTINKVKKELITLQTIKNRINRGRKKVQDTLLRHTLFKNSNK
jgi:hypothetical protein